LQGWEQDPFRLRTFYFLKPKPMKTNTQRGIELIRDQIDITLKLFLDLPFQ